MFKKYLFILLFVTSLASISFGQVAKSAFSSLGIGEPYSNALVNTQGMGGVGIANSQSYYLNNQNPALMVYNSYASFGAGFVGERRSVRNGNLTEKNSNGNLGYLYMAFPMLPRTKNLSTTRWSSSLVLMPYSNVNYKLTYTKPLEGSQSLGAVTVTESGSGGINQLVWANGVSVNRYISVGIKARYLFGARIDQYSEFVNQAPTYQPNLYERQRYSDFNFTGGISFHKDSISSKNYRLNLGLIYDLKTNVKTTYYRRLERLSGAQVVDSATLVRDRIGNTVLPPSLGAGFSIGRRGWRVAGDVIYTDYKKFRNDFESKASTQSTMHYGLGGEFTPYTLTKSYLSRITYRAGATYDDFPYLIPVVQGGPAKDVGINLGISLPVSTYSSIDLAVKVGKRGDLKTNGIAEDYFRIYFGATFNDIWFYRRKFE